MVLAYLIMKDRCSKSVGDAKQTLEIRVEPGGAVRDNGNGIYFLSCTYMLERDRAGEAK